MKTFGQVFKEARKAKKMTCREIADAIESTIGHISDLEHGRVSIPALSEIEKLEGALEITDGRLMAFYNPANPYQEKDRYISTTFLPDGRCIQLSTDSEDELFQERLRRLTIAIWSIMVNGNSPEILTEAWKVEE